MNAIEFYKKVYPHASTDDMLEDNCIHAPQEMTDFAEEYHQAKMKEEEVGYKLGQQVKVIANESDHEFSVGEFVTLVDRCPRIDGGFDWDAENEKYERWSMTENEFKSP